MQRRTIAAAVLVGALVGALAPASGADPRPSGPAPALTTWQPLASDAGSDLARLRRRATDAPTSSKPIVGAPGSSSVEAESVPGELIVTYRKGTSTLARRSATSAAGATVAHEFEGERVALVKVDAKRSSTVMSALRRDRSVEHVDPNYIRRSFDTVPTDPQYSNQAGDLQLIRAPRAWDRTRGDSSTVVAVLDSGIDQDHPDLAPNIIGAETVIGGGPQDELGHGTAVAGVIAAQANNGIGISGVAPNVKIRSIKVLDASGSGSDADIMDGIDRAILRNVDVINMSLGGPGQSDAFELKILDAIFSGITVVVAAGNTGSDALIEPAAAPGVIAVSAVDTSGHIAWFSSYGAQIAVAAPGVDVYTTKLAPGPVAAFEAVSGTSFSSPMVAGVAALVKDRMPAADGFRVGYELIRTANDRGAPGFDRAFGFGIVDAAAAVGELPRQGISAVTPAGGDPDGAAADAILVPGASTSGTISPELDEDWFAFDVPTGRVALTVTPANGFLGTATANLDPILELYDASDRLLATSDETFWGEAETVAANVNAGRVKLRVRSYSASESRGGYTVGITSGAPFTSEGWAPFTATATGSYTNAVVVADFTGDGRKDVVASTAYNSSVANDFKLFVYAQQPNGTLGAATKLATHGTYFGDGGLTTGDFDGDGDADVALATNAGVDVAYQGVGGLAAPTLVSASAVRLVAAANVDGTIGDEIVTVSSSSIDILTRTGGGTFTSAPVAAGNVSDVEVRDVTGDSKADIVGVNALNVRVYAQGLAGTWPLTTYDVSLESGGFGLNGVAVGELTGDSRNDVAVTVNANAPSSRVLLLAQKGDGTLDDPLIGASKDIPEPALAADVDGDADQDLVVLHGGWLRAGIYVHGASGLGAETLLPISNASHFHPQGLAVGDIDGDGLGDIVAADSNSGVVIIRHKAPTVSAPRTGVVVRDTTPTTWARNVSPTVHPTVLLGGSVSAATVDDNTVALFESRSGEYVPSTIAYNSVTKMVTITPTRVLPPSTAFIVQVAGVEDTLGNPIFEFVQSFVTAAGKHPATNLSGSYVAAPGDYDGNGATDVYWYGGHGTDSIFFSTAIGFFPIGSIEGIPAGARLIPGDFDGDGYDDIYVYFAGKNDDAVLLNGPNGGFFDVANAGPGLNPIAGDFNADGYDDIVFYTATAGHDGIWYGGSWVLSPSHGKALSITGSYRPTVGDYEGDGDDDIFWYGPGSTGDGMWTGGPTGFGGKSFVAGGSFAPFTSDIDGNGFDDIVWYASGSPADSSWMFKSGLTYNQVSRSASGVWKPFAGDLNGDGYGDAVWYAPGTAADAYWYGSPTGPVN